MNTSISNTAVSGPSQGYFVAKEFWEAMADKHWDLAGKILSANPDILGEVLNASLRPRNYPTLMSSLLNHLTEHLPSDRAARVAHCTVVASLLSCVRSYQSAGQEGYS